jgi:hypothetical protein
MAGRPAACAPAPPPRGRGGPPRGLARGRATGTRWPGARGHPSPRARPPGRGRPRPPLPEPLQRDSRDRGDLRHPGRPTATQAGRQAPYGPRLDPVLPAGGQLDHVAVRVARCHPTRRALPPRDRRAVALSRDLSRAPPGARVRFAAVARNPRGGLRADPEHGRHDCTRRVPERGRLGADHARLARPRRARSLCVCAERRGAWRNP